MSAAANSTNELDEAYFSHSYVRRLRAEVLLDTITRITGTEDRFSQAPPGTRAVQLYSGNVSNYFLTTFGRAPRESACSCEVNSEANLSQALHLINGDTVTQKIAQSRLLTTLIGQKKSTPEIIEDLYVRALCRKPTDAEVQKLTAIFQEESGDSTRVTQLAAAQARVDATYRRGEEQLKKLREDLEKLQGDAQDAAAAKNLEAQIQQLERQLATNRARFEANVPLLIYNDILWGIFNSTEFAFNH